MVMKRTAAMVLAGAVVGMTGCQRAAVENSTVSTAEANLSEETGGGILDIVNGFAEEVSVRDQIASAAEIPSDTSGDSLVNVIPDYEPFDTSTSPETTEPETAEIDVTPLENVPISPNWSELLAANPDTRGWVKITGTSVNNVVVQGIDNDYYLSHDFFNNESISGTIFSSYKNKWDGVNENIVLFGHTLESGEFFSNLKNYLPNSGSRDPLAFYKVHPTIMLATPDGGCETYKIFAGVLANTQEEHGEVFEYGKTYFSGKDDFNSFILEVMERSWFFTDVDLKYGDQLLTLSTNSWILGEQADIRCVLFARKVRPGESESVDVTLSEVNHNPRLFKTYYDQQQGGGSWNGICEWDKSKLLSY